MLLSLVEEQDSFSLEACQGVRFLAIVAIIVQLMKERMITIRTYVLLLLSLVGAPLRAESIQPVRELHHSSAVTNLLEKFTRRVTILEIGRTEAPYTLSLAGESKAIWVSLLAAGGGQDVVREVRKRALHNVTVLAPTRVDYTLFETLGRCEHFDVVIVHDLFPLIQGDYARYVKALCALGDYVFIESSIHELLEELKKSEISLVSNASKESSVSSLFLSDKPKVNLEVARFTQRLRRRKRMVPRYRVISDFHEKFFLKRSHGKRVRWVDGINLVTFVMLKGRYPFDALLRQQIMKAEKMHPDHNDLVIGNFVVQGDRLIPIDFGDHRRNESFSACIGAVLLAFQEGNSRLSDPGKWMRSYYEYLDKD